jgi:hypothetical protein
MCASTQTCGCRCRCLVGGAWQWAAEGEEEATLDEGVLDAGEGGLGMPAAGDDDSSTAAARLAMEEQRRQLASLFDAVDSVDPSDLQVCCLGLPGLAARNVRMPAALYSSVSDSSLVPS